MESDPPLRQQEKSAAQSPQSKSISDTALSNALNDPAANSSDHQNQRYHDFTSGSTHPFPRPPTPPQPPNQQPKNQPRPHHQPYSAQPATWKLLEAAKKMKQEYEEGWRRSDEHVEGELEVEVKDVIEIRRGGSGGDGAATFELIPKLSGELRNIIWTLAANEPRVVEVKCDEKRYQKLKFKCNPFYSTTLVPAILHVCRESRSLGLKFYTQLPSFGDRRRHKETFINWQMDFLALDSLTLSYFDKEEVLANLNYGHPPSALWLEIKEHSRNIIICFFSLMHFDQLFAYKEVFFKQLQSVVVFPGQKDRTTWRDRNVVARLENADDFETHWMHDIVQAVTTTVAAQAPKITSEMRIMELVREAKGKPLTYK
ncbi:hypothetical protein G7Y89_g13997 [Cudoniella acicularis]|uniref:2EXR domain-containing protein n=1 Tax=Cudoniella acicularis TaxID=354080 RepID=A0A8H4VVI9_9HELO|nr:hypothetical protein G7Y89_g13997 [Cudoniella acicularis]